MPRWQSGSLVVPCLAAEADVKAAVAAAERLRDDLPDPPKRPVRERPGSPVAAPTPAAPTPAAPPLAAPCPAPAALAAPAPCPQALVPDVGSCGGEERQPPKSSISYNGHEWPAAPSTPTAATRLAPEPARTAEV